MADEILPEDQRRLAVTIVIEDPQMWDGEQSKVHAAFTHALEEIYGEQYLDKVPYGIHLAISRLRYADLEERIRGWTREPTEEEEMGIVKHGEGRVIPESEQQRKKQASHEGLSQEAVDEIVAEGREGDDSDD